MMPEAFGGGGVLAGNPPIDDDGYNGEFGRRRIGGSNIYLYLGWQFCASPQTWAVTRFPGLTPRFVTSKRLDKGSVLLNTGADSLERVVSVPIALTSTAGI